MSNTTPHFDDWYRSEYTRVLAATGAATNSLEWAEDATTDAFVKALERWDDVSKMDSPTGWTISVAVNNVRRTGRRRRRTPLVAVNIGCIDQRLEAVGSSDVWDALGSLPDRQRHALLLRYADDFTQREVAAKLGVAPGTVAATLNHARKNFRLRLLERGIDI